MAQPSLSLSLIHTHSLSLSDDLLSFMSDCCQTAPRSFLWYSVSLFAMTTKTCRSFKPLLWLRSHPKPRLLINAAQKKKCFHRLCVLKKIANRKKSPGLPYASNSTLTQNITFSLLPHLTFPHPCPASRSRQSPSFPQSWDACSFFFCYQRAWLHVQANVQGGNSFAVGSK